MALIEGISVTLISKVANGVDDFNCPVYDRVETIVDNVLVVPASSDDVISSQSMYGKKAVYTLGIPKSDTHDWTDCEVKFFGQTWRSIGFPLEGIAANIPLDWNKKVMVERYG